MFIRDPWTTTTWQQSGNPVMLAGLGASESDSTLLTRLHALALSLYQAQQDVISAQGRGDTVYVQSRLQDVQRLRDLFNVTAQQFQGNDAEAIGAFGQFLSGVADFERQVGDWIAAGGIGKALAFIPNQVIGAVGIIGQKAGAVALGISIPVLLLGAALLVFLGKAERTRTFRRYVA
jgi:hypothetical protein